MVHRWRTYDVFIDGSRVGMLTRTNWNAEFSVPAGRHLVQIRAGRLASAVVAVTVRSGTSTLLTCGPRALPEAAARRITNPQRSIFLRDEAWSSTAVPHRLPFAWRVTRYDPALRTDEGWYSGNAWTAISDIGEVFEDGFLTRARFEETEAAYLDAVRTFAADAGVTHLQVRDPWKPSRRHDPRQRDLVHGEIIPISEALEIVREMLRETNWCRLEALTDDFTVHVGDHLYLYIGSTKQCRDAVAEVDGGLLFVEPFSDEGSPYIPNDGWLRPYETP